MPAYEYRCNTCEYRFEQRQRMSDPAIEFCPKCGGSVSRLISGGAGVISKGSHSTSFPEAGSGCGSDGLCCGQGVCGNKQFCEQ